MKEIKELDHVASVTPAMPNKEGNFAIITVVPETGPNDAATKDLVKDVRSLSDKNGVDLLVNDCQQYKRKTNNEYSKHRYRIIKAIWNINIHCGWSSNEQIYSVFIW